MAAIPLEQALQLALTYQRTGRPDSAEAIYRQILAAYPRRDVGLHQIGMTLHRAGRHAEAAEWIAKAIAENPANAIYHADLGIMNRYLGRVPEAIASYRRALELEPSFTEVHNNLGEALICAGEMEGAIESCGRALALRADYPDAFNNLGAAYLRLGRVEEAIESFCEVLKRQPNFVDALKNLVAAYSEMDRWEEAIACGERAMALQPREVGSLSNLGVAYRGKGDLERALKCFREAVAVRPDFVDAHWNLACLLLMLGQYEEGWKEYEWRWKSPKLAAPRAELMRPRWEGGTAAGQTILVHAEQGFGDTLQFVRYLSLVRERAGAERVVFACPRELERLLVQSDGWNAEILVRGSDTPLPAHDWQVPMLGLPRALGLERPDDPAMAKPAYLQADAGLRKVWRKHLGPRRKNVRRVGLAWQGQRLHENDARRSISAEMLLPILKVKNVKFFRVVPMEKNAEPCPLAEAGLVDRAEHIVDFADTAAMMAELDLVISVDTAAAHLAGALGLPVWTLLPFMPDWRWGVGREETPWYPTMRLFRQTTAGDWRGVIERVIGELGFLASPTQG